MLSAFRKAFSLDHCDYPFMLSISAALLRSVSLNVDPRHEQKIPKIFAFLLLIAISCYLYVYLFSMVWFVFIRCLNSGEVLIGLIVFSLGVASEIGLWKLLFMFLNRKKLLRLSAECLKSDALLKPGSRISTNILKTLRAVKMRAVIFWAVIMGNGFLYIIKPVLLPGRHLFEDLFVLYGLEPMFESPNYEIAFAVNATAICITVYLPSNTVLYQIISAGYLEAQMLAWSEELLHLWDDANKHYLEHTNDNDKDANIDKDTIINEFINQRFKVIIQAHATNINLHRMVEDIFRSSIVVEFITLMISLVAELLGGLENTYLEVPFSLMQVGVDCFIGQRVIDASLVYQKAVYECKWERFNDNNMRIVKTMMIISNKTMYLTAGSVTKLNFDSFLGIVKSIFSMYTTLRATM